MSILRVAIDIPLPRLFDYTSDDASPQDIGRCVRVPFGSGAKLGVIVARPGAASNRRTAQTGGRNIAACRPCQATGWHDEFCSRYYQHPLGEVMALALPPYLRAYRLSVIHVPKPCQTASAAGSGARCRCASVRVCQNFTRASCRRRCGPPVSPLRNLAAWHHRQRQDRSDLRLIEQTWRRAGRR